MKNKVIYLYVKTHNDTGLKYFGKTSRKNPYKYKGSGVYWKRHLKKHGSNFSTEIIGTFSDELECSKVALRYSIENDVVNSQEWANLKEENGQDGSPLGVKFSEQHKDNIRKSRIGKCYNPFTEDTRRKMGLASEARNKKMLQNGTHPFAGERGSKLAKERNKKLLYEGKHNFQAKEYAEKTRERNLKKIKEGTHEFLKQTGTVPVINKNGDYLRIKKEVYYNQEGNKNDWEHVYMHSQEGRRRRKLK
jgi:hypothetical protein